jgi:AraC-like DNA-binding protein
MNAIHLNFALSLYRVEEAPYVSLDLRGMDYPHWIVSHIRQGKVMTASRGVRQEASAGDVMIHVPGVPFDEIADGAGVHQWMLFDLRGSSGLDVFHGCPVPPVVRLTEPERYRQEFEKLLHVWQQVPSASREVQILAGASALFAQILESWEAAGSPVRPETLLTPRSRFAEIVTYMETHLADKLTREHLAGIACLHPVYFDRAFRAAHGVPPMQMLREMRLRAAQYKLLTTDDTLETVAEQCGMGDPASFSRAFRARFGQAPGRYRADARQGVYLAPPS